MTIRIVSDREVTLQMHIDVQGKALQKSMNEVNELRKQLAELEAAIEASRKQQAVAWLITAAGTKRQEVQLCKPYRLLTSERVRPLYATPVVAPDVLKDAERLDWLDNYAHIAGWVDLEPTKMVIDAASGKWFTGDTWRDAIDAAMGGEE